jgi:glycosyltransferase involved in cell wall biosynthesis
MRIALVSNFWYLRGGLEAVMFSDMRLLRARGHDVAGFAAAHPLNDEAEFSDLFPPVTDHAALGRDLGSLDKVRAAGRLFVNRSAAASFRRFLDTFKPDVVHQHGTSRQLSAAVLGEARRAGIPTVLTLHDYSLRCPAGTLSRTAARECIAVSCAGHRYDRAVRFKCVHDSRSASALAAVELLVARALRRYERSVTTFLVPSDYVGRRMVESGIPADRVAVMPNAIEVDDSATGLPGDVVVAYGRLVVEKGFEVVVEVARRLPDVRFVIAGDGPARASLEARASDASNVSFVGRLDRAGVDRLLSRARAVVVPSLWPEPFGMVVLEAWRAGRPVIVTDRGGIPEIVSDEQGGFVVPPGDLEATVAAVERLASNPDLAFAMGAAGRQRAVEEFAADVHGDRLEAFYRGLA